MAMVIKALSYEQAINFREIIKLHQIQKSQKLTITRMMNELQYRTSVVTLKPFKNLLAAS